MLGNLLKRFTKGSVKVESTDPVYFVDSKDLDFARMCGKELSVVCGDEYIRAQNGLLETGVPWVEFDPQDREDGKPPFVRFYNVMHRGFHDEKRVPYVFEWDREWFKHERRERQSGGVGCFSQDGLCAILESEKIECRPPTASEVHSLVLMLDYARRCGAQPKQVVEKARGFLKEYLKKWPLTLSRVDYDAGVVLQNFRRPDEKMQVDISGSDGYVRNLKDGLAVVRAVLNAEQSIKELDRMYNDLLGVRTGVYVWRLPQGSNDKRAVVLGGDNYLDWFYIDAVGGINGSRPALGVVVHSANEFF